MKTKLELLIGGLAAISLSLGAAAQMGPGGGMGGGGMGGMGMGPQKLDCAKAPDPAQCEAHNKALDICGAQRGPMHRECMEDNMPPPDCSKARNPDRCATMQAARAACKGKYGSERRQCMRSQGGMGSGTAGTAPPTK